MARLTLAIGLTLLAVVAGGCGSDGPACDDTVFVDQKTALAVAQGAIANAIAAEQPEQQIAIDLRAGADALAAALERARPCSADLLVLRETELASLARMIESADAFAAGKDPPREALQRAAADLTAVADRLVARKG
ncbi:MAG: hypothetical protein ACRC50_06445 [Gaiella sp.]